MRATGIKRANDALEDLLRHHSEALELDPQGAHTLIRASPPRNR